MKGLEAKTLGLKKVIRHEYKRIVAFMLTVAMVVTNFGTYSREWKKSGQP